MKLRHFTLEELHKATKNFSDSCLVGSGAFGNVYRGMFEMEGDLAIKKLDSESYSSAEEFKNGKGPWYVANLQYFSVMAGPLDIVETFNVVLAICKFND